MATNYIILVVYYQRYFDLCLLLVEKIISRVGGATLIIVDNSPTKFAKSRLNNRLECLLIDGSNSNGEFSAWDEGIESIHPNESDRIILMNDTFCHHHQFTIFNLINFCSKFKKMKNGELLGDIHTFGEVFSIKSISMEKWVSTYLFAGFYSVIKKALPFSYYHESDVIVKDDSLVSNDICPVLSTHINKWLSPKSVSSWYGSGKPLEEKKFKFTCILNEAYFTAKLISHGVVLIPIYRANNLWLYHDRIVRVKRKLL